MYKAYTIHRCIKNYAFEEDCRELTNSEIDKVLLLSFIYYYLDREQYLFVDDIYVGRNEIYVDKKATEKDIIDDDESNWIEFYDFIFVVKIYNQAKSNFFYLVKDNILLEYLNSKTIKKVDKIELLKKYKGENK